METISDNNIITRRSTILPDIGSKTGIPEELYVYVRGYEAVEELFGKSYSFHDAEIVRMEVENDTGVIRVTMIPSDGFGDCRVIWTFEHVGEMMGEHCDITNRWLYELVFQTERQWINVFFDGTDLGGVSCLYVDVKIERP